MPGTIHIEGQHAELASPEELSDGIEAAREVFERYEVEPLACAAAIAKLKRDELLNHEEARLCVIWSEAEDAAVRAITVGWLCRNVDLRLVVS